MTDFATSLSTLREQLPRLSEADQRFARSLLGAIERFGGLSERQRFWVGKLADRATRVDTPRASVGDLTAMIALFDRAGRGLRNPAIVFRAEGLGDVRISVAGPRARVPGSLNVTSTGSWSARVWYGRVLRDGTFEPSTREDLPPGLVDGLRGFAADPAGAASRHGHATGQCCFCARPLSDERSTSVGYGPICAERWGLAWGGTH